MKLSVIVPNYNHGFFINEQIESIINQTYKCHEIIIIDDKSTDNSVETINKIIDKYPFIKFVQNKKNIGVFDTLNYGLKISSGDHIIFPSADDRMCSNFFEEASKQFKLYPDAGLFSGLGYQMDKNGKFLNLISSPLISLKSINLTPEKVKKYLAKYGSWIVSHSMIYNKSSFKKLDIKFNPDLKHFADTYVNLIIALRFGACFTPKTLACWRYYSGYAEQIFLNESNNHELLLKFINICNSNQFNESFPKKFLSDMMKNEKIFYINRKFYFNKQNRFLNFILIKMILKFFIYIYVYKWELIKIFRILWSKRRFKEHYDIKDDLLLRE